MAGGARGARDVRDMPLADQPVDVLGGVSRPGRALAPGDPRRGQTPRSSGELIDPATASGTPADRARPARASSLRVASRATTPFDGANDHGDDERGARREARRATSLPRKPVRGRAAAPAGRARDARGVGAAAGPARRDHLRGPRRRGQGRRDQAHHRVPEPAPARIVALPAPTERERGEWYFQRYIAHLPAAGEIVLFDRSWYNRAGVEHVMGFCTPDEYRRFLHQCPIFERLLVEDGIILSSTGSPSPTRSRSAASSRASTTRCGAGSSRASTSRPARAGRTSRAPRTRCSCTRTSPRCPGTSSRPTTSGARASTASRTCSR